MSTTVKSTLARCPMPPLPPLLLPAAAPVDLHFLPVLELPVACKEFCDAVTLPPCSHLEPSLDEEMEDPLIFTFESQTPSAVPAWESTGSLRLADIFAIHREEVLPCDWDVEQPTSETSDALKSILGEIHYGEGLGRKSLSKRVGSPPEDDCFSPELLLSSSQCSTRASSPSLFGSPSTATRDV
mmetsp:Transcript_12587/g.21868  ORF Transcript_12587/g.21868 Transcript_12587/m.21868 type:complete len:184 (+) Transcript_12587:71-622(+)